MIARGAERVATLLSRVYDRALTPTTELTALLTAHGIALDRIEDDIARALAELFLDTANAEWLDYWGEFFDVPRQEIESDAVYGARIVWETIRPRMDELSIEDVLNDRDPTCYATAITPLKRVVFASSRGRASQGWHVADGRYWHGDVVDVGVDNYTSLVETVVQRNRAAGILAWVTTRIRQLLATRNKVLSGDGVAVFSAQTVTSRGNHRMEDITNPNELVGAGFLIANAHIYEESI